MAIRFRKSIKLAPGIRWNISGSGSSFTLGPRGFSLGVGTRGSYLNTGIPGSGLYSRSRLTSGSPNASARPSDSFAPSDPAAFTGTSVKMTCGVSDDGTLYFQDAYGQPMPEHWVEKAKKQNREAIQNLIRTTCEQINSQVEALGCLHHETPDPRVKPKFVAPPFDVKKPVRPIPAAPGFVDKVLGRANKIAESNSEAQQRFERELQSWDGKYSEYEKAVAQSRDFIERAIYNDPKAMEQHLSNALEDIGWPRETEVTFDIRDEGQAVALDVDLPEVEHMPTKLAAVPSRGLKLSVKQMSGAKVQELYSDHVHGIVFRLIGEVFAALPTVQSVITSGYSQRPSKADGQIRDEYLLSVQIERAQWEGINFKGLAQVDPSEALAQFDLRRDMTKGALLRPIQPHLA
ncbi:DUF4236 domain-containing protein [Polaromonas sp. JS666]|uniref:DUF4236 domain-containing protein n=1 Tax=Polaromonas sp. (strain JS666 / ATCC BAA-500) TaxID=296591 RepID=UPI0000464682|nr:DUF4236 domain-containing protein [Polaromonas sp. JS666]ABE47223.1 conserved hypothetical protein [Polaromonas sp. JS666]